MNGAWSLGFRLFQLLSDDQGHLEGSMSGGSIAGAGVGNHYGSRSTDSFIGPTLGEHKAFSQYWACCTELSCWRESIL